MGQQESEDENTVQLLFLQKKSVVWYKLIGMKTLLRRQIHPLFILTSNIKDKVAWLQALPQCPHSLWEAPDTAGVL